MPFGIHRVRGPVGLAGRVVEELVGKAARVVAVACGEAGGVADLADAAIGVIGRPHHIGRAVDGGRDLRGPTERVVGHAAAKAVAGAGRSAGGCQLADAVGGGSVRRV